MRSRTIHVLAFVQEDTKEIVNRNVCRQFVAHDGKDKERNLVLHGIFSPFREVHIQRPDPIKLPMKLDKNVFLVGGKVGS